MTCWLWTLVAIGFHDGSASCELLIAIRKADQDVGAVRALLGAGLYLGAHQVLLVWLVHIYARLSIADREHAAGDAQKALRSPSAMVSWRVRNLQKAQAQPHCDEAHAIARVGQQHEKGRLAAAGQGRQARTPTPADAGRADRGGRQRLYEASKARGHPLTCL